jgi:hypothetical protein
MSDHEFIHTDFYTWARDISVKVADLEAKLDALAEHLGFTFTHKGRKENV